MKATKIVVIGAGSASFGPSCLRDAIHCRELSGSKIVLVDLDAEKLEVIARLAHRLNDASGAGLVIEHTTDRKQALPRAQFVITSIAMNREALWKLDWEIPLKHGIKHVQGENGGPGGLAHALRNIPVLLDICRDMEKLCPNALLINFSNPLSRMCLAVSKHTSIKSVGLCHGIYGTIDRIRRAIGVTDIDAIAAGLNHFTWLLSITRESTGEDLYSLVRAWSREAPPDQLPLTRHLLDVFGLYPSPGDEHIGEYISYAWELVGLKGYNFDGAREYRENLAATIDRLLADDDYVREYVKGRSGEIAFNIIRGILADTKELLPAVNIPNRGCVTNLPSEAIVEVPAIVGASGIMGLCVGDLPDGIAAMCNTQVGVQKLVVQAAVTGSRQIALQAMLADPVVQSAEAGAKCLDELLAVHAPYLPQFA